MNDNDKLVVIHQPDFIPYLGFFDRLDKADIYVVFDNVQYVRMAQDYLPADFCIGQMRAEYKKQALLGDRIIIMVETAGDICTVALCDEEQKPYAVVEFQKADRMRQGQNKENGEDR